MKILLFLSLLATGPAPQPVTPPQAVEQSFSRRILDALYSLIWPMGKFDSDLETTLGRVSQKSGDAPDVMNLYLVRAVDGTATEWRSARGGQDPVFCADEGALFYRRGSELWRETLKVTAQTAEPAGPPARIAGVRVKHLYACVRVPDAAGAALWADDEHGKLRWLVPANTRATSSAWRALPPDFAVSRAEDLVASIMVLRSMRPGGLAAFVSDGRLVGQRAGSPERSLLSQSPVQFFGYPMWLGDRDLLIINGAEGGKP